MKKLLLVFFCSLYLINFSFSQTNGCQLDIVLAFDVSGSNMGTGTCLASNQFVTSLLTALDSEMDGSIMGVVGTNNVQVGLCTWSTLNSSLCDNGGQGYNVQVSPMTTASSFLNAFATGSNTNQIIGVDVTGSDFYYAAIDMGMQNLNDFANSALGDRSGNPNYQRILIILTDANSQNACTQSTSGGPCAIDMQNDVWNFGVHTIAVAVRSSSGLPPPNWQLTIDCLVQDPADQYEGNGATLSAVGIQIAGQVCQPTFLINNTCFNDPTSFNINQGSVDAVSWDFGDPVSGVNNYSTDMNPTHIFSAPGTFNVTLFTYINGNVIDTIISGVVIQPIPVVDLGSDTVMCEGEILTLDATVQNATYLWQGNSTDPTYNVSLGGDYFVEVTVNGCINIDTIHVSYNPPPNAIISGVHEICYGDPAFIDVISTGVSPFQITYTNGIAINVITGADSISIETSQAGTYTITNVIDQFGCSGNYSGSAEIIVNTCSLTVYIPNSFTPNGDGINEVFNVKWKGIMKSYKMHIYNRWGDLIFTTDKPELGWDGRANEGERSSEQEVYVYIFEATDFLDSPHEYVGKVVLLR